MNRSDAAEHEPVVCAGEGAAAGLPDHATAPDATRLMADLLRQQAI
ncbi:hypothetical protein [Streptomyces sp. cf124]|nr:hypothetical protein [Streptomyces sp. cf124]